MNAGICAHCTQRIATMRILWCCVEFIYIFDSSIFPVYIKSEVFLSSYLCVCARCSTCRLVGKWMLRRDFMFLSSAAWPSLWAVGHSVRTPRTLFDIRHQTRNSGLCNLNLSFIALASPYTNIQPSCGCLVSLYLFRPTLYACTEYWFLLCFCSVFTVHIVSFTPCVQPYFSCTKLYTFFFSGCLWWFWFRLSGFRVNVFVAERMN